MTIGEDRNKDGFKNWKLCVLWKLPFRHHGAVKSRRTTFALPVSVSIPLFRLPSLENTNPRSFNASTCFNVFLLTCRKHCFECLKKHNTSIFLDLIFVPAWSHAAESPSNACWRLCWDDSRMQCKFVRKKQMVHPAVSNSGTSLSTCLWLSIQFI